MKNCLTGFYRDMKVLYSLAIKRGRGETAEERLESFYSGQAEEYDHFRRRLLTGREDLMSALPVDSGAVWVDMGCGTGSNLELLSASDLATLKQAYMVDLTEAMLKVADARIARNGWRNVSTQRADATNWSGPGEPIDVIFFSYSLSMIPDWFAALDRAYDALKPGGVIGVVDFYIARKTPYNIGARQSFSTRWLWPIWFSFDNVFLSSDVLPYLERKFTRVKLIERADRMPYCPFFWKKTPRFVFIGRKPL